MILRGLTLWKFWFYILFSNIKCITPKIQEYLRQLDFTTLMAIKSDFWDFLYNYFCQNWSLCHNNILLTFNYVNIWLWQVWILLLLIKCQCSFTWICSFFIIYHLIFFNLTLRAYCVLGTMLRTCGYKAKSLNSNRNVDVKSNTIWALLKEGAYLYLKDKIMLEIWQKQKPFHAHVHTFG